MSRLAPLVIGTLLALSCAAHALPQRAVSAGPCDNGPVQCCDNLTSASALDAPAGYMLRILLGVPVYAILDNVGTGCAPLDGDSANCGATAVCCEHNHLGGSRISLACTPVTI